MSDVPPPAGAKAAVQLPVSARDRLIALLALGAIAAFLATFAWDMYRVWTNSNNKDIPVNARLAYLGTGLAGLVGGIVAVGFGQKPPATAPVSGRMQRSIAGLARIVVPSGNDAKQKIAILYVLVYFVVGFAAVLTWLVEEHATQMVTSFAVSFIGLVIAIVSGYFKEGG